MKCFLKIDRGSFCKKESERYIRIPLEKINPDLYHNNNFQTLCEFTMGFESENALKAELMHQGLLSKENAHFCLGIGYVYNGLNYFFPVPYMDHKRFFEFNTLCNFISRKIEENRKFAIQFLFLIKDEKGLNTEHCYELKKYGQGFYQSFKPDPWVKDVLKDIIKRNGKTNFKTLYYVAMIAYKISPKSQTLQAENNPTLTQDLSEGQRLHTEEEIIDERENPDQMSLF